MSMTIVAFIIAVILFLAILFYILSANKNTKNNTKQFKSKNVEKIDLNNIILPKNIERMNFNVLSSASKSIFESFKSLNYLNKLPSSLDKIEWHTWQVSIILMYLKAKKSFIITNDKVFHDVILSLTEQQIEQEMQKILKKYLEHANIENSRDKLSRDIIWSAREVSIIIYKIVHNK